MFDINRSCAHTYSCTTHLASGQMSENLRIKIKSSFICSRRGKCTKIHSMGFCILLPRFCLHSIFHENFSCESLILNEGNWDVSPYLLCWKRFFCFSSLHSLYFNSRSKSDSIIYQIFFIYRWEDICKIHFRFAITKHKASEVNAKEIFHCI